MPVSNYKCKGACGGITVALTEEPTRAKTVSCPTCGHAITYKDRDQSAVVNANRGALNPAKKTKTSHTVSLAQGRAPSAPTRTDWPGLSLNHKVTHCSDLSQAPWTTAGVDKICLAYNVLDTNRAAMEGFLVDCPQAVNQADVQSHFSAVKAQLVSAHNNTQICEATGEAAAALCILQQTSINNFSLAGFEMVWGMHVHSGTGIDQIWKRATTHDYLIVEAKGPGASLNQSPSGAPSGFSQMGMRWVMHNLITMSRNPSANHQVARDIITELGLTVGNRWPAGPTNVQQGSKSYYGVTGAGVAQAQLYRVVVTASWQGDGMLSYSTSRFKQYTNFTK